MSSGQGKFTILYNETGNPAGRPLLFLHGTGLSNRVWLKQYTYFTKDYCLAPNLHGNRDSAGGELITPAATAKMLAQFCRKKLNRRKINLIGTSWGAQTGLLLMQQAPELIASALLYSCRILRYPLLYKRQLKTIRALPEQPRDVILDYYQAARIHRDLREPIYEARLRLTRFSYKKIYKTASQFTLPRDYTCPRRRVLLLCGSEEDTPTCKSLEKLSGLLPGSKAYQLQGATGAFIWQNPGLFNLLLEAWLKERPLPGNLIPLQN